MQPANQPTIQAAPPGMDRDGAPSQAGTVIAQPQQLHIRSTSLAQCLIIIVAVVVVVSLVAHSLGRCCRCRRHHHQHRPRPRPLRHHRLASAPASAVPVQSCALSCPEPVRPQPNKQLNSRLDNSPTSDPFSMGYPLDTANRVCTGHRHPTPAPPSAPASAPAPSLHCLPIHFVSVCALIDGATLS